jgi:hypothetical protein
MTTPSPHPFRSSILLLSALTLLTGCNALSQNYGSYDFSSNQLACAPNPNDPPDTLLSGKQPDESKRHADDWATPLLGDSLNAVGDISKEQNP